jgi:argininosuccinate lyase
MPIWAKGYEVDADVLAFTTGDDHLLDRRLVPYDCRASIAHAEMLAQVGLLSTAECAGLVDGLETIVRLWDENAFEIRPEQEDCHTAIEEWLTANVGEAGKKLHVGRSRNDQVLTALRLYEKDAIGSLTEVLAGYRAALLQQAERHAGVPLPGYTHMRKAMPTTVGTWLGAFAATAADDADLLAAVTALVDRSPLGTGAGYGVPTLPLDRVATARALGFSAVLENPIHAHFTRGKTEAAVLGVATQILLGLNRLASDLLLFSMDEFGFVALPDALCTGSSIMPQKKNPDLLELVRGQYHVVAAEELKVKSLLGNLMTGYQRDLGLTKGPVFVAFDVTVACLRMMRKAVELLEVDAEACASAMTSELYATEEAYRLVEQGVPFREAYRRIAQRYVDP